MIDGRIGDAVPVTPAARSVAAICVQPVGADLVAATAFDTLARKMGHGGVLCSLRRETVWLLSFDCEPGRARELTAALATNTGIFVNPNTHRHAVVAPPDSLPHGTARGREAVGAALWLYDDPEAQPVQAAVRDRMGVTELTSLTRLSLWWFGLAGRAAGARSPATGRGKAINLSAIASETCKNAWKS